VNKASGRVLSMSGRILPADLFLSPAGNGAASLILLRSISALAQFRKTRQLVN
jgi:hypothetical protein